MIYRVLIIISCMCLSGCFGTFGTRTGNQCVGEYPYKAIVLNVGGITEYAGNNNGSGFGSNFLMITICVLSLPIDIAIDTVLLPVDLISWPFGMKKGCCLDKLSNTYH